MLFMRSLHRKRKNFTAKSWIRGEHLAFPTTFSSFLYYYFCLIPKSLWSATFNPYLWWQIVLSPWRHVLAKKSSRARPARQVFYSMIAWGILLLAIQFFPGQKDLDKTWPNISSSYPARIPFFVSGIKVAYEPSVMKGSMYFLTTFWMVPLARVMNHYVPE